MNFFSLQFRREFPQRERLECDGLLGILFDYGLRSVTVGWSLRFPRKTLKFGRFGAFSSQFSIEEFIAQFIDWNSTGSRKEARKSPSEP
jgi:hypothetical protein